MHVINNLLFETSNLWSLWENLKPWPSRIDLAIAWLILKQLLLVNSLFSVTVIKGMRAPTG